MSRKIFLKSDRAKLNKIMNGMGDTFDILSELINSLSSRQNALTEKCILEGNDELFLVLDALENASIALKEADDYIFRAEDTMTAYIEGRK